MVLPFRLESALPVVSSGLELLGKDVAQCVGLHPDNDDGLERQIHKEGRCMTDRSINQKSAAWATPALKTPRKMAPQVHHREEGGERASSSSHLLEE
jgi:hypothetical protein